MKKLLTIFTILLFASVAVAQGPYNAMFSGAADAIAAKDAEALSEYVIVDDVRSPEMAKAFSELLIVVQSGKFKELQRNHGAALKQYMPKALSSKLMGLFAFAMIPPLADIEDAASKEEDGNTYAVVQHRDKDFLFEVKKMDGSWHFWPAALKPSEEIIEISTFFKEFVTAIENNEGEALGTALEAMVEKYVELTALEYKEQTAVGKIAGNEWEVAYGQAKMRERFGKNVISIELTNVAPEEDCPFIVKDGSKVMFSVPKAGEYDLIMNGMNISLSVEGENRSIIVTDGKILIDVDEEKGVINGKIAVQRDEKSYINGSFEISICTDDK
jgi:hypothetical protein